MTKKTATTNKTNAFASKIDKANTPVEEVKEEVDVKEEVEEAVVEEPKVATSKKKVKKFEMDDMILCQSVSAGQTFVKGIKTGTIYTFEALGAEEYIEYKDLIAFVRSRNSFLFKPFIIVLDEDFINEQTKLKTFYDSMYTPEDFEEFFTLTPSQMKEALNNMPVGIRETIKNMAAGRISEGRFDSVARIKALDEYFNTKLMLLTELYNND